MTAPFRPRISDRISLLGGELDPITPQGVLAAAEAFVDGGGVAVVANHNLHSLFLLRRSAAMRAFFAEADLVQIDSTPLIAWGRLIGLPLSRAMRSTYLDWREAFWARACERGWRVYHLGGAPGLEAPAMDAILKRWPQARLKTRHGYFDPDGAENDAVLADIAAYDPDIILVGMGMPRQEAWIAANRGRLARGVLFAVGAAFDYEAGAQIAAPRALGRLGLEWLFRLVSQPRRLAARYLVEPWFLLPAAAGDLRAALSGAGR